jgi:hypothetical protein
MSDSQSLRHISEATRPLLRGWLDRFNRTAARAGLEPHERLELFLALPADEQRDHFAQLREYERGERILDGDLDWPEPARPEFPYIRKVSARCGEEHHHHRAGDDVLDTISPHDYWPALTGEVVPPSGRVRCPDPGHEDLHPSVVVYSEPGRGWWCPVCGAGGTAVDLAAIVTGIEPRGEGYWRLRELIVERLLNAPIGRAAA